MGDGGGRDKPLRLGVLFFDDVEELDAVGPWEVLAFWARNVATDPVTVLPIGLEDGPVRCAHGLSVNPDVTLAEALPLDVLVYPGGPGARHLSRDEAHLARVRELRGEIAVLASVCTGALALAAAGLLAGRPATTHWRAYDQLVELDSTIDLRRDARYVDDGDVVTSAGISSGIDMALALVERFAGEPTRVKVARALAYDARHSGQVMP